MSVPASETKNTSVSRVIFIIRYAFSEASRLSFVGARRLSASIVICGFFVSLFEILGTAFSMQAVVSTISNGRALRAGNAISEKLGYDFRFDSNSIVGVVVAAMVISYFLSIVFSKLRERSFARLIKIKCSRQLSQVSKGRPFNQKDYNQEIRVTKAIFQFAEIILFSAFIAVFLLWLSIPFALVVVGILGIYIVSLLYSSRHDLKFRNNTKDKTSLMRKKAHMIDVDSVSEFFNAQQESLEHNLKKQQFAQVFYIFAMTIIVCFSAITFEPGQVIVMPLLIILSIRKLMGSARGITNQIRLILELRTQL